MTPSHENFRIPLEFTGGPCLPNWQSPVLTGSRPAINPPGADLQSHEGPR